MAGMVALGADAAGYPLKEEIKKHLERRGTPYKDFGTHSEERCDYPLMAEGPCEAVQSGEADKAILVCGTGIGIAMAANKHRGIRAAPCTEHFSARYTRLHNDANALCLGGRVLGTGIALELVDLFLDTEFEGGRHARRVGQINALDDTQQ